MRRLRRLILIFALLELRALVGKMALLVTVVTDDLAQVFIFLLRWPIAVAVILS